MSVGYQTINNSTMRKWTKECVCIKNKNYDLEFNVLLQYNHLSCIHQMIPHICSYITHCLFNFFFYIFYLIYNKFFMPSVNYNPSLNIFTFCIVFKIMSIINSFNLI